MRAANMAARSDQSSKTGRPATVNSFTPINAVPVAFYPQFVPPPVNRRGIDSDHTYDIPGDSHLAEFGTKPMAAGKRKARTSSVPATPPSKRKARARNGNSAQQHDRKDNSSSNIINNAKKTSFSKYMATSMRPLKRSYEPFTPALDQTKLFANTPIQKATINTYEDSEKYASPHTIGLHRGMKAAADNLKASSSSFICKTTLDKLSAFRLQRNVPFSKPVTKSGAGSRSDTCSKNTPESKLAESNSRRYSLVDVLEDDEFTLETGACAEPAVPTYWPAYIDDTMIGTRSTRTISARSNSLATIIPDMELDQKGNTGTSSDYNENSMEYDGDHINSAADLHKPVFYGPVDALQMSETIVKGPTTAIQEVSASSNESQNILNWASNVDIRAPAAIAYSSKESNETFQRCTNHGTYEQPDRYHSGNSHINNNTSTAQAQRTSHYSGTNLPKIDVADLETQVADEQVESSIPTSGQIAHTSRFSDSVVEEDVDDEDFLTLVSIVEANTQSPTVSDEATNTRPIQRQVTPTSHSGDDEYDDDFDDGDCFALMSEVEAHLPSAVDTHFLQDVGSSGPVDNHETQARYSNEKVFISNGEEDLSLDDDEYEEMNLPSLRNGVTETFDPPFSACPDCPSDSRDGELYDRSLQYSQPDTPSTATGKASRTDQFTNASSELQVSDQNVPTSDRIPDSSDDQDPTGWAFINTALGRASQHNSTHRNGTSDEQSARPEAADNEYHIPLSFQPQRGSHVAPVRLESDEGFSNEPLHPFARPNFPVRIRDRSPITGLSSNTVLRICFRIGEAIKAGSQCESVRQDAVIELFARVTFSSREDDTPKQHFQFRDLFHDRAPFLSGILENYKCGNLTNHESKVLIGQRGVGKMVRCVGRLKRDVRKKTWVFMIMNVRATDWEEIRHVKTILTEGRVKKERLQGVFDGDK